MQISNFRQQTVVAERPSDQRTPHPSGEARLQRKRKVSWSPLRPPIPRLNPLGRWKQAWKTCRLERAQGLLQATKQKHHPDSHVRLPSPTEKEKERKRFSRGHRTRWLGFFVFFFAHGVLLREFRSEFPLN